MKIFYPYWEKKSNGYETIVNSTFQQYFGNVNLNKFKEEANPKQILKMIYYLSDEYMRDKVRSGMKDLEIIKAVNFSWIRIIRNSVYKEEYL